MARTTEDIAVERASRQPNGLEEAGGSVARRGGLRVGAAPYRSARPRFEPRCLADDAEVDERRNGVMLQCPEQLAPIRPPDLIRDATGAADAQHDRLRGCEIDRPSVRVDRKTIRYELHGASSSCRSAGDAVQEDGPQRITRQSPLRRFEAAGISYSARP
jgi:hypothetical protein